MSILGTLAEGLLVGVQVMLGLTSLYILIVSLAGTFRKKEPITHKPEKSFAIFVAAHNEEQVIEPLIKNLQKLDYPSELYDIFVICDNCTDGTADIVRRAGAIACERFDDTKKGKGFAIEWMLENLWNMDRKYDAVMMVDADNLVSKNFLLEMNEKLMNGHRVIQGYLDIKNPLDSWVTVSYSIGYYHSNRMWQMARYNLGLSSSLGGTGVVIESDLLKEMGWGAHSLTEDVEFTARCVERGIYPSWAHNAKVYDEKPVTLKASWRQRLRWMQGHFDCFIRYFNPLIVKSVKKRSWAMFDAALYLFQPMRLLIMLVAFLFLYLQYFMPDWWSVTDIQKVIMPKEYWLVVNLIIYLQVPFAMMLEKVNWKVYLGLVFFPIFVMTWFPITLVAFFTKNNKTWSHTVHTRSISLDEISH